MKHIVKTEGKWDSTGWDCKVLTDLKAATYFMWDAKDNHLLVTEGIIPEKAICTVVEAGEFGPNVIYQGKNPTMAENIRDSINEGKALKLEELQYSHGNNPAVIRVTMDDYRDAKREAFLYRALPTLPDHQFTLAWEDAGPIKATAEDNKSDGCLLFLSCERGPVWHYPAHEATLLTEETTAKIIRSKVFPKRMGIIVVLEKDQQVVIRLQGMYDGWQGMCHKSFNYKYEDHFLWNGTELVERSTRKARY